MNVNKNLSSEFNKFFSESKMVGEGDIASKNLTPSHLHCPARMGFKLRGAPMMAEDRGFEARGYAEAGNSRHRAIQEFLIDLENIEWIDPEVYVKEKNLPFEVYKSKKVLAVSEKYNIPYTEACSLLGEYEVNLVHKTQPLSFKLDGLIKYKGEYYIVEIKTVGKKDLQDSPLDKHQWQGKTYSFLLKIPRVLWIYECRENFKIKTTVQVFEPEEQQQARNRLNHIILDKDDPHKLERDLSKCGFCRYKAICAETYLASVETSKSSVPF
jgi:CRISPR/Cas system-associated exonuclease Cas4 (RecB family)